MDGKLVPRLIGRHLADCASCVDRDRAVYDARSGIAMTGALSRGLILLACAGGRPCHASSPVRSRCRA